MEERSFLSQPLVLPDCNTQKNRVETGFWISFAPGNWATSAWSSPIINGKASYPVMVLWVMRREMTHHKWTQKCTLPEPREITTQWYTLAAPTVQNRPFSKPLKKGWWKYDPQLLLQSSTSSVKWITNSFESHWISNSDCTLQWIKILAFGHIY